MKMNHRIVISISLFTIWVIIIFVWVINQLEMSGTNDELFIQPVDTSFSFIETGSLPVENSFVPLEEVEIGGSWFELPSSGPWEGYEIVRLPQGGQLDARPKVVIVFVLVVGITSYSLIRYLMYSYKRQMSQITQGVKREFEIDDSDLQLLNEELSKKNTRHLIDYQRLQTYLSHEQKNVLAVLRTDLERANNEELLKKIDRLSQSMDDVLTLSDSIENSEKVEVDISLIAASVCDTYQGMYSKIRFDFDEDADLNILGKERWIYRAVSNILDNAIKYGEENPIFVEVTRKNNSVILSVKDEGIGIERQALTKIFDPHFRVNELHKDGYGIGLSLVAHVCDLCEGVVWVDSEVGNGSTFYLSFPAANLS